MKSQHKGSGETEISFDDLLGIIKRALEEDVGKGDVTTNCIVPAAQSFHGEIWAKEDGIIAGLEVARQTFAYLDSRVDFSLLVADGERVENGQLIARLSGPGRALLSGERVALNFMQRMSGIATLTRQFLERVKGPRAKILDTRKTAPGLRLLDKWAVRLGGGMNHRHGLYDMVLIKENHIAVAGSISEAVKRVRQNDSRSLPIEVEVKTLSELEEAIKLKVDRILLDNMPVSELRKAVELCRSRIPLEASGNVRLENVRTIAETGVDFISVGALTHSVKALDISLLLK